MRDIFAPPANVAFHLQTWPLNPGIATSFPWLSQIAQNFDEYEFLQLIYTFRSTVADFAASSGQVGTVVMVTQYNPSEDDFGDKDTLMGYVGSMSTKVTDSLIHGIECDPEKNSGTSQKYVRLGGLDVTEDLKNYDHGKTSLAILNAPATYAGQQLGELWVTYTVRLRKPKLSSLNAYNTLRDYYAFKPSTTANGILAEPMALVQCPKNSFNVTLMIPNSKSAAATVFLPQGAGSDNLIAQNASQNVANLPTQFTLTFPDSYTGVVELRMRLKLHSGNVNGFSWTAVTTAVNSIFRFKDMLESGGAGANLYQYHYVDTKLDATGDPAAPEYRQSELVIHLRLLTPVNGIPNTLHIALTPAVGNGFLFSIPQIEIRQINTLLSQSDNGKSDRMTLVDSFGQPTLWQ